MENNKNSKWHSVEHIPPPRPNSPFMKPHLNSLDPGVFICKMTFQWHFSIHELFADKFTKMLKNALILQCWWKWRTMWRSTPWSRSAPTCNGVFPDLYCILPPCGNLSSGFCVILLTNTDQNKTSLMQVNVKILNITAKQGIQRDACKAQLFCLIVSKVKSCSASLRITLLPNGTLKITNVTRRDAASYTCIAKNQFGTASTTGRLLITGEGCSSSSTSTKANHFPLTSHFTLHHHSSLVFFDGRFASDLSFTSCLRTVHSCFPGIQNEKLAHRL